MTGLMQATGCSWGPMESPTATPRPEATPADIPDPPGTPIPVVTPLPLATPTPLPDPTPTPEPVRQAIRVARTFFTSEHFDPSELPACVQNTMTRAGLVRLAGNLTLEPGWAESWEPLEDRDGWRFRVRPNQGGWGEGVPVTAHDFAASWRRALSPDHGPLGEMLARLLFDIEFASEFHRGEASLDDLGIVVVDDWTLEIRLERERVSFPYVAASPALTNALAPADHEDEHDECWHNGLFSPETGDDRSLVLTRNRHHWSADHPVLDRIELTTLSASQALSEFRQEAVDLMLLTGSDATRVRQDEFIGNRVRAAMPQRIVMLAPNVEFPPFDSPEVRRAMSEAIDRRRLELIVEGRAIPATRLFPAGMFLELDDASGGLEAVFDVDAAYGRLAGTRYNDPAEWPSFGLDVPTGENYLARIARDVAMQIRENFGIQIPVRFHDADEYAEGLAEHRYPLAWIDWTYQYADPACAYADLFGSWRQPGRPVTWSDPDYDDLVRASDTLPGRTERASAYAGCEGLLREQGAYIPLVHPVNYFLVQPTLDGLPFDSRGRLITGESIGVDIAAGMMVRDWPE
jgi:oligopeptide transport system substrate-binding protein